MTGIAAPISFHVQTPGNWFVCPNSSCKRIFTSRSGFKTHARSHAGKNCGTTGTVDEDKLIVPEDYTCEHCAKVYKSKTGLDKHVSYHHGGGKMVKCDEASCAKSFGSVQAMQAHMLRLHGQGSDGVSSLPFVCSVEGCRKRFRRTGNLFRHEQNTHQIWSNVPQQELVVSSSRVTQPLVAPKSITTTQVTKALMSPTPSSPTNSCSSGRGFDEDQQRLLPMPVIIGALLPTTSSPVAVPVVEPVVPVPQLLQSRNNFNLYGACPPMPDYSKPSEVDREVVAHLGPSFVPMDTADLLDDGYDEELVSALECFLGNNSNSAVDAGTLLHYEEEEQLNRWEDMVFSV